MGLIVRAAMEAATAQGAVDAELGKQYVVDDFEERYEANVYRTNRWQYRLGYVGTQIVTANRLLGERLAAPERARTAFCTLLDLANDRMFNSLDALVERMAWDVKSEDEGED
jgi:hypothetical protein